jgi:hypothetical protein
MTRLVQFQGDGDRRVAVVEEPRLRVLGEFASVYSLAQAAIAGGKTLGELVRRRATGEVLDYDAIYAGRSPRRLMLPIDHPDDPARCLVSGTGLTHLGSARDREAMHTSAPKEMTDSMRMFQWGVEGGRPEVGRIGASPEWFYKGTGAVLRAHGEPLDVPAYAEDGGEEAEVAGVYLVGPDGRPWRVGMCCGNEFSDHGFEKRNYLYLAGSKIRTCALGPEIVVDPDFGSVAGTASIEREGNVIWSKHVRTGEQEMCHSLANIEHHHFKFETHRRAGDLHVHYFGAHSLSFGEGVKLRGGDVMEVKWEGFGRALRNPLRVAEEPDALVSVSPLG